MIGNIFSVVPDARCYSRFCLCKAMGAPGFQRLDMKAELEEVVMSKIMCKLEPCMTDKLDRASTCKKHYFSHKLSAKSH